MSDLLDIAKDALRLDESQRLTPARILLELSETSRDYSTDAASEWEEEIVRRIRAVEAGSAETRTFDEVFAELDRRFPG